MRQRVAAARDAWRKVHLTPPDGVAASPGSASASQRFSSASGALLPRHSVSSASLSGGVVADARVVQKRAR